MKKNFLIRLIKWIIKIIFKFFKTEKSELQMEFEKEEKKLKEKKKENIKKKSKNKKDK